MKPNRNIPIKTLQMQPTAKHPPFIAPFIAPDNGLLLVRKPIAAPIMQAIIIILNIIPIVLNPVCANMDIFLTGYAIFAKLILLIRFPQNPIFKICYFFGRIWLFH